MLTTGRRRAEEALTEEQWQAIKNKDGSYDGQFFYALKTTKTVCRPSCVKKTCSPENVVIFLSVEDAIKAGYHPCKRCRPDQAGWKGAKAELAETARLLIEKNYKKAFSLDKLAQELHINKYYLLRTFKEATGDTPLSYHNSVRCGVAKEMLKRPDLNISYISDETGFSSASHFSRVFAKTVGITPSGYRKQYLKSLEAPEGELRENTGEQ